MGRRRYGGRTSLVPEVKARHSYIDSVAWRMPALMPAEVFRALVAALESEVNQTTRGSVFLKKLTRPDWVDGFYLVLWVHQPTPRALQIMQQDGRGTMYAVHVALDLCVADSPSVQRLRQHVERRLHKNLRPARLAHRYEETTYIGCTNNNWVDPRTDETVAAIARRGTALALYSDNLSKVSLDRCVHIEHRTSGGAWLRAAGLGTIEELLRLDHCRFWDSRLMLLNPPTIGRVVAVAAEMILRCQRRSTTQLAVASRADRLVMASETVAETFSAHGIDYMRAAGADILRVLQKEPDLVGASPVRLFHRERNSWMLPQGHNAMWRSVQPVGDGKGGCGRDGARVDEGQMMSVDGVTSAGIKTPNDPQFIADRGMTLPRGNRRTRVVLTGPLDKDTPSHCDKIRCSDVCRPHVPVQEKNNASSQQSDH